MPIGESQMEKRAILVAAFLLFGITLVGTPSFAASKSVAPKVGAKCPKVGQTASPSKGVTLTCAKSGKSLIWKKILKAPSKPSTSPSSPTISTVSCGDSSLSLFTKAPFNASDVALITNGEDTNDARLSYVWVKSPYTPIPIYAPADGVLVIIRHLTATKFFPSDDYQLQFNLSENCDDNFRFNHITQPRADIKAAYQFGDQCSSCFDDQGNPTGRFEEREKPGTAIKVKAGELLGYTSGTPNAHDFDFGVGISQKSLCPYSVLAEPFKTELLALLGPGPKSGLPYGQPKPGYGCTGYGARL